MEMKDTLNRIKNIFLLAMWFGLMTGVVEGLCLYLFQRKFGLEGQLTFLGVDPNIIWISPIIDSVLFGIVSILLILLYHFTRMKWINNSFLLIFLTMVLFSWLFIPMSGHISIFSVLLLAVGLGVVLHRSFAKHINKLIQISQKSLMWISFLILISIFEIQGGRILKELSLTEKLAAGGSDAPNILVIVIDTLRADHLSSYGYSRKTSPTVDNYALQGVLFENTVSTSSWTQPAHASFLTGRYTYEHGAELQPLDTRYPTLAEILLANGYRTGAFSGNVDVFNRHNGLGRGFIHFEAYYQTIGNSFENTLYGRLFSYYLLHRLLGMPDGIGRMRADDISHSVLDWITQDNSHPFFVFINYYDVHAPYTPPQPYRSKFSDVKSPGGLINTYWDTTHIYVPKTNEQIQNEMDAYDGAISYVDENIDWLLNELQQREILNNTIVVITSDHGEAFGEHGLLEHTNALYWEEIHVPLIIIWPDHVPAGERISTPVSITSLAPTLLELANVKGVIGFASPSLATLWRDSLDKSAWPYPISELAKIPWAPAQNPSAHGAMSSVVSNEWHYIVHKQFGEQLFKWVDDRMELQDCSDVTTLKIIVSKFRKYLQDTVGTVVQ